MTFVSTIRLTHNPGTTFSTDRQIIQKSCHKKLSHFFLQCRSCPFLPSSSSSSLSSSTSSEICVTIFLNGPNLASFLFFSKSKDKCDKNIDGVLGTRTWGGRIEAAYESTELWRHPIVSLKLDHQNLAPNFRLSNVQKSFLWTINWPLYISSFQLICRYCQTAKCFSKKFFFLVIICFCFPAWDLPFFLSSWFISVTRRREILPLGQNLKSFILLGKFAFL